MTDLFLMEGVEDAEEDEEPAAATIGKEIFFCFALGAMAFFSFVIS